MALKYCQSHKCHTYDTKDRKRGSKNNRKNQTRRRSELYYGGNFCSLNCYNDWADQFMNRAIDSISGRLHEPMTMSEENAWRKQRRYHWGSGGSGYHFSYYWHNACTGENRDMSEEDFNNQNLQTPN
jgi:hypothetical protein